MERFVFDVPKVFNVNTNAIASGSIFSKNDEQKTMPVTASDGNSYEVVLWGGNNQLPYQLKRDVEKNTVLSQDKLFNVLTCYGKGLEYMDIATRNEKKHLPTADKNVVRFLMRNNMKRFFAEQITDMKYYFFSVCVVILDRQRKNIVRLVHKDACNVRFQKANADGVIEHILFADWEDNNNPEHIEAIPLLDEYDTLTDLLARTDREKDPTGSFRKSPKNEFAFAIVCRMPTVGCQYYPVPYWTAPLRDGWYQIYGLLTAAKQAKIKNGNNIRYHVEISTEFWESRARAKGISINTKEYEEMKSEAIEMIRECLAGSANSDKMVWSEFQNMLDGKERHDIKINVVDTSKAGSEYNEDISEVSNMFAFSDNVHPNLAGATPGKSQMNNSGSDKRELFTMKQALEQLPHDMMFNVHNTVIYFNGWSDKVYPEVPFIQLTTLDKNKDAQVTTTENGGQENGNDDN